MDNLPTIYTRDLVKEIALDIGKEVVAYVEWMYPKAIEHTSSTFKLSLRNCIFNQIMEAIKVNDAGQIEMRLEKRKKFRRDFKKLRAAKSVEEIQEISKRMESYL